MKKVGILTFHSAINYGAILQAYALLKKIMDMGCDAELIDYSSVGNVNALLSRGDKGIFKRIIKYILRPISEYRRMLKRRGAQIVKRMEDKIFREDLINQKESFYKFKEEYLKFSGISYNVNEDLKNTNSIYDKVITGSDQVWNPLITQNDLTYFLNFLSNDSKKVSYAASFGIENISWEFKEKMASELRAIKHLSVREVSGAEIIKKASGRDAAVVVDPTLLLSSEEWRKVIPENNIDESYIFFYSFLGDPSIVPLCKYLSKLTGYKIIGLSLYQVSFQRIKEHMDRSISYVNGSGPLEFLSYLSNASIVVTNSFHGAIFSINFQKDFFVIPPRHSIDRIISMLDLYKLSDRLLKNKGKIPDSEDILIDYSVVTPIVERERKKSMEFLRNSLKEI